MLLRKWLSAWVLLLGALPTSRQLTPCLQQQEASPKRFVSYHQHMMPLSLAVSARPSHRLVSNVFYIFLKEVLGYDNVIFVEDKYQFNFTNTLINFISESTRSYMINLEAWKPAHFNYIPGLIQVKEFGLIAPPGWFGWWVPSNLSRIVPYLDHWRVFSSQETAGRFYQDLDHIRALAPNYKFDGVCETSRKELCNLTEYTPARCRFKQCAVLLADNPGTSGFVVDDIENLELWVRVVWVGNSLGQVVATLTQAYLSKTPGSRPPVFLDFTPSLEVPDNVAYSPIAMPLSFSETYHHKYDAHRLVKVGWSKLTQIAKPAHEALLKVTFNWADYQELLEGYKDKLAQGGEGDPIWEVACSWLKNHRKTRRSNVTGWEHWVPQEEKDTLVLGGIFPLGVGNKHSAPGSVAAMQMALDAVNSSPMVLRHYNVTMLFQDGACEADRALKSFIDIITNGNYKNLIGILGPGCSESVAPLAGLASKFNTLVISYSAEGSSFTQDKYPLFFRTIGENKQYRYVYLELLKRFNWERLAALAEDGISYTEYLTHTHDLLQANKITFIENRKFPKDWKPDSIPKYLEELKAKNARIIILDAKEAVARAVMCEAFRLGMTAKEGYVWFLPYWLPVGWYDTTLKEASHVPCNTQQMLQAIDGHLSLSHQFFAPPETMTHENITVADWQERYHQRRNNRTAPSNYAGFVYDAVWTYAYAVDKLFKENQSYVADIHSDNVTNRLVQLINETDFMGVSGHIHFANGSSRVSPVNVNQWINKSHHVLATYYPSSNHSPPSLEWIMEPKWLSGGLPDDGKPPPPVCLVASLAALLNTDCEVAIVIANIIGFGFAGLFLIVGFIFIKHRYDKKVEATQQFMKSLGIDISSPSTLEGLDKWEIPRDRVVINRKLGEGAFGTVYGGEAHFTDKGWVAVAVKTLKVGSTTEEKLDFLSEAEVMKRFDHKNIVKLLGVCTKNEPIYTIMEFMLYGDLKTFLLARRHLVNEKQAEESEEVSSKKLTSMALDVARALSYLAQLRYVHRDVASRNCLVNASRVVKLGDFGMTRPMFESDYYKFNRKGMLPVRWMAPESLALGVFSPASDVWSYGVLLFEIITFGSFPFQGMSNNQVLEYVKAGHTITIPEGVKPQLENLIRSCWEQDYKKRPAASDIVEIIANNPRLLSVCLDAPLSSVQLDSEFGISSRKFSVSLRSSDSEPLLPPGPQHIALTTIPPHHNNCHHNSIL